MLETPGPATHTTVPVPGQLYGGYRINRLLGRGGMGAVYEAEVVEDGRLVALKLLAEGLDDADTRRRFLREGHLAATLNHPNTVYIYGTGEVDGTPVIAMELVAGGTLETRVEELGPMPIADAIEASLQIIDGLAAAYGHGILHRDIKPSNCFVGVDGAVKVGDFGLSKSVNRRESTITKTGMFLGTPAYSSPEQLLGEPLDLRSDIYSLGGTLYYLLTAKLPFEGASAMNVMAAVLQGSPAPPRKYRAEIPERLAAVVLRCLARNPVDRYPDYAALRAELEGFRSTPLVPAPVSARIGAMAMDLVGMFLLGLPLLLIPGVLRVMDGEGLGPSMANNLLILVCLVLWRAVPEGLWGASPGKTLLGLKVVRTGGVPMGMARSLGRSVLLWFPVPLPDLVMAAAGRLDGESDGLGWSFVIFLAGTAGLFATMRRSNGFAGLHDLIMGTRVTRPSQTTVRRRHPHQPVADRAVPEDAPRIGQFALLGPLATLADGSELISAVDPALRRGVWVHRYSEGRRALDAARRNLAREGRLRWVAGRRAPGDDWDAYEVPEGRPLLAVESAPVSWETCRDRMADLAGELVAAKATGEHLNPGADRVWIASNGRAMVLDFPAGPVRAEPVEGPGAFLEQVARLSLTTTAQGRWPVLPLSARSLLDELPSLSTPESVEARLRAVEEVPGSVSRRKRGLAMALTAVPAIFLAIFALSWVELTAITDPELVRLIPMVEYLERPPSRETDSARTVNSRTIGIYLAGLHRKTLTDSVHRRGMAEARFEWPMVDSVLRQYAGATPEEIRLAAHTVDSVWKNLARGPLRPSRRGPLLGIGGAVLGLLLTGVVSLAAALLIRTGTAFRTAGIEIVTNTGKPAGRLRLLIRAALVWLPLLLPFAILSSPGISYRIGRVFGRWASQRGSGDFEGAVLGVVAVLLLLFAVVSLITALRNPSRGVADRIAGTHLVPR